jgi:hypothetical protein
MIVAVNRSQTEFNVYKVSDLDCTRTVVGSCDPAMKFCYFLPKNDS